MKYKGKTPGVFLLAALAGVSAASASPSAHRLDEYLQATLVAIERDRVDIELNLTPGVSIAPNVIAVIDRDGSGRISSDEEQAYARDVLAGISLEVDGRAHGVALTDRRFPTIADISQGLGTIRLTMTARVAGAPAGAHEVLYRNMHRSDLGVYLANALVPSDPTIEIGRQQRDGLQHELRIEYRVAGQAGRPWAAFASAGIASMLTMVVWWMRRSSHARTLRSN